MKAILISSIPLMGKSTYAAQLIQTEKNTVIICPDQFRQSVCGNASDMSRDGFIWGKLIPERLSLEFLNGDTVIFDSVSKNERARRDILKMLKRAGFSEFACHFIRPDLELALARNKIRERKLPEEVIERFAREWTEPTLSEGFAEVKEIPAFVLDGNAVN